eukprot:2411217-Heterocapsa_arctica.AAC.1
MEAPLCVPIQVSLPAATTCLCVMRSFSRFSLVYKPFSGSDPPGTERSCVTGRVVACLFP